MTLVDSRADASPGVSGGSAVVAALEAAYGALRACHPDLPDVVITTGVGRQSRGLLWGSHCPGVWQQRQGDVLPHLFISGECLSRGGTFVWLVICHEAAHALASVRGITDCSGQGNRYHNGEFRKLADELGCWYPLTEAHPTRGYTDVELTDVSREMHGETIAVLDQAIAAHIAPPPGATDGGEGGTDGGDGVTLPPRRGGADRNNMKFTCECEPPRIMRMAPKVWELGAPMCPCCEAEFA